MRKVLGIALLALCFVFTNAFAGGTGNCIQPLKTTTENIGMGAAFGYNYVPQRLNDLYNFDEDVADVKVLENRQVYGQVSIGLNDNRNLFIKAGACDYELRFKDVDTNDDMIIVDVDSGFYAGVGMNTLHTLAEVSPIGVPLKLGWGYEVQANGYINDVGEVKTDATTFADGDGTLYGFDGQESLYLTCRYDIESVETSIVPYIGIYHSWLLMGAIDALEYTRVGNKTGETNGVNLPGAFDALAFGLLLGVDLEITKYANLNVEGRFIGETAITTGATVKF